MKKVEAIKKAVIELCTTEGLTNLTTASVAKQAGVSPATIYLYYQSKVDLLSRLYEEVKEALHQGLAKQLKHADDEEAALRTMLQFSIDQAKKFPKETEFVARLWIDRELLDEHAITCGEKQSQAVMGLYHDLQASGNFAQMSFDVFAMLAAVPTQLLQQNPQIADTELNNSIDLVVKAMKN